MFKSNLPDVPSGVRFQGFGMKKIVKVVYEMRSQYIAKERSKLFFLVLLELAFFATINVTSGIK